MSNQSPESPTADLGATPEPLFQTPSGPAATSPSAARGCVTLLAIFGAIFVVSVIFAVKADNKSRECKEKCSANLTEPGLGYATKYGFDEIDLCIQHCQLAEGYCPSSQSDPTNHPKYEGCFLSALDIVIADTQPHSSFCGCGRKYKYSRGFGDKIEMELVP